MRNLLVLAACMMMALPACAKENKATLTANLTGVADGTKIVLIPGCTHQMEEPVAEATVDKGTFRLEIALDDPRVFYLRADKNMMSLMAAPGDEITITGTFEKPVVSGSEVHRKYDETYLKPRAEMGKMHDDYNRKYADIAKRMGEARASKDQEAIAVLSASEEWKALSRAEGDFFKTVGETVDKLVVENASTFWGPLLLMAHTSFLVPDQEKLYDMFSQEAKDSFYGKAVAAELFGITGQAPAFTAKDADGVEHTLQSLLKGDNYVLVDFWASWCGPCRRFVPTVRELAAKYAADGLVVVSISSDKDRDAWLKALGEEQMPWLNLLDESNIGKAYGVSSIPSIFLIDPRGNLVFSKQHGQSVIDKLQKTFGR